MRYDVSKLIYRYMVAMVIVYTTTLSVFPGIESEIISCQLGSWMPVINIALFNVFDLVGKVRKMRAHVSCLFITEEHPGSNLNHLI